MRRRLVLVFVLSLSLWAGSQDYTARGLVTKVDASRGELSVSEDAIPGFMDAMSMTYHVEDPSVLRTVHPGEIVQFKLTVDSSKSSISAIKTVPYTSAEREPLEARSLATLSESLAPAPRKAIAPGERVPDFSLIDQTDHAVTLSQFAGKVVVLTFVYTRCPLPDYCLRLSNNFGQLQRRFGSRMGRDLILISVTFDPVHDTPAVLAQYAKIWNASGESGWHLLTGPLDKVKALAWNFGANFWQNEGALTHSLHTVVIGRDGKLVANIEGNRFTATQLGDLVQTCF